MNIKLKSNIASLGLVAGGILSLSLPAQAASFTGFTSSPTGRTLSPNCTVANQSKCDIRLDSAKKGTKTYTAGDFLYVTGATKITNTYTGGGADLGPGSSDHGDLTTSDTFLTQGPRVEEPSAADIVASLGNNNLNSIIDTEDNLGESVFDVYFSKPTDTFFFWERGNRGTSTDVLAGNSDLEVTAIVAGGAGNVAPTLGGTFKITRNLWTSTGIITTRIDTTEIAASQELGTYGLMYDSPIIGLRLTSKDKFNGPDYKVVGAVPEPLTMLGAGTALGFGTFFKRKLAKKQQKDNAKA